MKPRDQPFERDGDINLDGQLVVGGRGAQAFRLAFDLVEGIAYRGKIRMAGGSEFGAASVALEELQAQLLLQSLDLMAHR